MLCAFVAKAQIELPATSSGGGATTDASSLTTGTLSNSRLDPGVLTNVSSHTVTGKVFGQDLLFDGPGTRNIASSTNPANLAIINNINAFTFQGRGTGNVVFGNNNSSGNITVGQTGTIGVTSTSAVTFNQPIQVGNDIYPSVDGTGNVGIGGRAFSNARIVSIYTDILRLRTGAGIEFRNTGGALFGKFYDNGGWTFGSGTQVSSTNIAEFTGNTYTTGIIGGPGSLSLTTRNHYLGSTNNAAQLNFARGSDGSYQATIGYGSPTSAGSDFYINAGGGSGRAIINGAALGVTLNSAGSAVLNANSTGVTISQPLSVSANTIVTGGLNIGPTQSVTAASGGTRNQLVIEDNTSSTSGITINSGGSKSLQVGHMSSGGMYLWTNTGNVNVSNHLQPFSHNSYDLGLPGTRWRNVYVSGTVLTVNASASSDIEVTTATSGIILKSPNGTRYRITIDDTGTLVRTAL